MTREQLLHLFKWKMTRNIWRQMGPAKMKDRNDDETVRRVTGEAFAQWMGSGKQAADLKVGRCMLTPG